MWNYRLVRHKAKGMNDEDFYAVHEAYYDKKGKVWGVTQNPSPPRGDSKDEVIECIAMMLRDILRAPVLDYDKVPEKGAKGPGGITKNKRKR